MERPSFDIETACRVCLSNSTPTCNIFLETCSNGNILADVIMEHAPVKISPEDGHPPLICSACYEDLEVSLRFRYRCVESDRILNSIDASDRTSEPTDEDVESILRNVKVEIRDGTDDDADAEDVGATGPADGHDDRPFECGTCGKRFRRKHHLSNHWSVHTGAKPFSCRICERRFTRRESYLRHSRIHSGDYPYTCTRCGKRFIQRTRLIKHSKVHEKGEPAAERDAPGPRKSARTKKESDVGT